MLCVDEFWFGVFFKPYSDKKMEKISWSSNVVTSLIDLYREEKVLYDCKDAKYHNKAARREALERITFEMGKIRPGTTGIFNLNNY